MITTHTSTHTRPAYLRGKRADTPLWTCPTSQATGGGPRENPFEDSLRTALAGVGVVTRPFFHENRPFEINAQD